MTDQLVPGIARHPREGTVHVQETVVGEPKNADADGTLVEHCLKPPLAGTEVLLHLPALGDVLNGAQHPHRLACQVVLRAAVALQPTELAVRPDDAKVDVQPSSRGENLPHRFVGPQRVVRMQQGSEGLKPAVKLRHAHDVVALGRPIDPPRANVPVPSAEAGGGTRKAEAGLGQLAARKVVNQGHELGGPTTGVQGQACGHGAVDGGPVTPEVPLLCHVIGNLAPDEGIVLRAVGRPLPRVCEIEEARPKDVRLSIAEQRTKVRICARQPSIERGRHNACRGVIEDRPKMPIGIRA